MKSVNGVIDDSILDVSYASIANELNKRQVSFEILSVSSKYTRTINDQMFESFTGSVSRSAHSAEEKKICLTRELMQKEKTYKDFLLVSSFLDGKVLDCSPCQYFLSFLCKNFLDILFFYNKPGYGYFRNLDLSILDILNDSQFIREQTVSGADVVLAHYCFDIGWGNPLCIAEKIFNFTKRGGVVSFAFENTLSLENLNKVVFPTGSIHAFIKNPLKYEGIRFKKYNLLDAVVLLSKVGFKNLRVVDRDNVATEERFGGKKFVMQPVLQILADKPIWV